MIVATRRARAALVCACLTGAAFGCREQRSNSERDKAVGAPSARATSSSPATPAPAPLAGRSAARGWRDRARVPAVAVATVTREETRAEADGFADVDLRQIASADTVFEAASIAKTVIATAVMQLVEEGRVTLDADVETWLGFPARHPTSDRRVTLRMLLTHRAGITDDAEARAARSEVSLGDFLRRYLARPAAFADVPGATYRYSNVGAALAALVVERVSGEDFAARSARRIFAPLGMRSTGWRATNDSAVPHAYREGRYAALPQAAHALYPVVDLRTSARDLARFARAMLRGGELDGARVLAEASVGAMLAPNATGADDGDGLGWQTRSIGGARVVGHEGEDAGASTAMFLDPKAGVGAIWLSNGDAFTSGDASRSAAIGEALATLLARARAPVPTPSSAEATPPPPAATAHAR